MPNPVLVSDLEARFRALTDAEEPVAQALLDDAWAILLTVIPDLEDRITAGSTSEALVVSVMSAMVLRVLRNPNGVRQWSVDDYSETRDSALSAGLLYASPDEVRLLNGRASSARRGAFSITPYSETGVPAPGAERDLAQLNDIRYGLYGPWG